MIPGVPAVCHRGKPETLPELLREMALGTEPEPCADLADAFIRVFQEKF